MKKLLLASFIMFGSISFASAQTAEYANPSATKTTPAPAKAKSPKEVAEQNAIQRNQTARSKTTANAVKPKRVQTAAVATEPKKSN